MEWDIPKEGNLRLQNIFFATFIFFLLLSFSNRSWALFIPTIRVLVENEQPSTKIEGYDLILRSAENQEFIFRDQDRAQFSFQCTLNGKINFINNKTKEKKVLSGPIKIESLGGFLKINGRQFRDDLFLYSSNKECLVVNHVDLEKYVAGLLHSEMNASWNLNTLMAQAVAARSYAIYQMIKAGSLRTKEIKAPFDLESTIKDQVYEGANQERYRAIKAVEQTRGMVLTYKGEPIKAFYHSTCGGSTESVAKVWGKSLPYMKSVHCGFCNKSPRYNWRYVINKQDFQKKLNKIGFASNQLTGIKVLEKNGIGRAHWIEIKDVLGTKQIHAIRLRDLLGTLNIMSTDFEVHLVGDSLIFNGRGSGHGVGMCQYGAKAMGEAGFEYSNILKHYYPEAKLTRFY